MQDFNYLTFLQLLLSDFDLLGSQCKEILLIPTSMEAFVTLVFV